MTDILSDDTIVAPATVPGTGAVCMIRTSGPHALEICDEIVSFKNGHAIDSPGNTVKFGTIASPEDKEAILDEVLVNIYRKPHSYTGEDSVEIICHSSVYIADCILELLVQKGARMALPGEFTRRAFLGGKMDLTQAEAVADLVASSGKAAHRLAMTQMKGGISRELKQMRERLLELTSLLELELDFSEEDVEFANRKNLDELLGLTIGHIDELTGSFALGNAIKTGVPVSIVGPANAGKSTLLNSILDEERAIVSDIPGTTRDTIEECRNIDGTLFRFVDTAGIRQSDGEIEKIGIGRSIESVKRSHFIILVLDSTAFISEISNSNYTDSIKAILEVFNPSEQKLLIALNKCDLMDENDAKMDINNFVIMLNKCVDCTIKSNSYIICPNQIFQISAKSGNGVKILLSDLASRAKIEENSLESGNVTISNRRHFEALKKASSELRSARSALHTSVPSDLVAEDLRSALSTLGSITGEITSSDILTNIFSKFCIGK